MSQILVTPDQIQQGSQSTKTTSGNLDQTLNQLKTDLGPLVRDWSGDAMQTWNDLQNKWNQAQTDLTSILKEIADGLDKAYTEYTDVEKKNKGIFQQ